MSKLVHAVVFAILLPWIQGIGLPDAAAQEGEADQPAETPAATKIDPTGLIALLDVGRAVQNHPRFVDSIAELKLEVDKAKELLNLKKGELENLVAQLRIHPAGTDEHMLLQQRISTLKDELTKSVASQKEDFTRREARVYHDAYQDVVEQSEGYARRNGIIMVLRFSSEEADVDDPQSILKKINTPVVWYDEERDITDAVLRELVDRWEEEAETEGGDGPGTEEAATVEPVPVAPGE